MNRDSIIRRVVAALALGLAAPVAIYTAATQEGVAVAVADDVVREAIIDATVTLRQMGRGPDDIAVIIAAQTGAKVEEITPVLPLAVGNLTRDPRSLRSESLTMLVTVADAPAAVQAGALAFCAPLLLGGDPTPSHAECVASQSQGAGVPQCVDGALVGYLVRSQATPSQAVRARASLASLALFEEPDVYGWGPCPEPTL